MHGTVRVLDFLALTPAHCRLVHLSTMAVAGTRPEGHVAEDELADACGREIIRCLKRYAARGVFNLVRPVSRTPAL
ncbi:hypothetical protein GCM10023336_70160 [Streptomyces similanensis]|uniref:Uncharacterized protein n=1 Tax=Streptomyces similanensis TaxID=1274988 RepID=A0ABP9LH65_9ACTN